MFEEGPLQERWEAMEPHPDERARRLFVASEAKSASYGGIVTVARATGMARGTIGRGLKDLAAPEALEPGRVRRPGGGRKSLISASPQLLEDLNALVDPDARGDPMSPLRWTCKSLRRLACELRERGHKISHTVVGELLKQLNFSLQANSKTREGAACPDHDAQFGHIGVSVKSALAENQPVISVDTKKKELVGDFKNGGREWRPKGCPGEVRVHDFLIKELGRAVPYGVYDLAANAGWAKLTFIVSVKRSLYVGADHDTSAFAVRTIRRWWQEVGRVRYPQAIVRSSSASCGSAPLKRLVITVDGGGSNGSRVRLWKRELQRLANELGIAIEVHHFPPGTSKWNSIEHRLFSFISQNWRATPLVSYRVIVDLIAATTTKTGLKVHCEQDANLYPKGVTVSDDEMAAMNIRRAAFHGEWNYTIYPTIHRRKPLFPDRS